MDQGEIQSEAPSVETRLTDLADRLRSTPTSDVPVEPVQEEVAQAAEDVTAEVPLEEPQGQTDELVEVDYEGIKVSVPEKVKDALLRQADYTRKTQEVSQQRKALEQGWQQLQQVSQLSGQLAPALGQLANMDAQIKGIHEQLTPDLEANDPIRYSTLGTKLNTLLYQRQQFQQGLQGHQQQLMQAMQQQKQQAMQGRLQEALPKVKSAIKDFSPDVAKQLAEYAKNTGYSQEEIEAISFSAPGVISLWKAREYDRLQSAKPKVQKQVANLPPVAKPGARNAVGTEANVRLKETMQDWKKGGGKNADQLASILYQRRGKQK
jgi:hypothetical protein